MCPRLQPYVPQAATLRAPGCSPTCRRPQPCVPQAAALCTINVPQVGALLAAAADLTALNADDFIKSLDAKKQGGSISTGDKCAITQNN